MKLSVVIPAFNEENGIGPTLDSMPVEQLRTKGYELEKIVVDNGSTDHTAGVARRHGARVISQPKRGYGHAYQAGFDAAKGDIVISGDADMTYPFDAIPVIIKKLVDEDLDFITTDRLALLDRDAMKTSHVIGNHILSFVMRLLFRTPFKDSQSGMWIFKRSIWPCLHAEHPGMPFSQEIKVEAYSKGFRCLEVPIVYRQRVGDTKLTIYDAWRNFYELFKKRLTINKKSSLPNTSLEEAE